MADDSSTQPPSIPSSQEPPRRNVTVIRRLLRDDPDLWVQHDARNRWFCPHCGETIQSIVVPPGSGLALMHELPHLILEHLQKCGAASASLPATRRMSGKSETTMHQALHDARLRQRHTLRPPPKVPGFEFSCLYRPMEAVGGDFYEFVATPGGLVGMGVGDASGHGVESCMLMAVTKKFLSFFGRAGFTPRNCLTAVNREIHEDVMMGVFISAGYVLLDPDQRELTYARAGHPLPILYNPKRDPQVTMLASGGIAIGLDAGARFEASLEEKSIQLIDGDLLVMYTDGIIELQGADGSEIGELGLTELLKKYYDRPVDDLVGQIWYQAEKLFQKSGQPDDITLVALRVVPPVISPKPQGA